MLFLKARVTTIDRKELCCKEIQIYLEVMRPAHREAGEPTE
jgi:hypothetical protein